MCKGLERARPACTGHRARVTTGDVVSGPFSRESSLSSESLFKNKNRTLGVNLPVGHGGNRGPTFLTGLETQRWRPPPVPRAASPAPAPAAERRHLGIRMSCSLAGQGHADVLRVFVQNRCSLQPHSRQMDMTGVCGPVRSQVGSCLHLLLSLHTLSAWHFPRGLACARSCFCSLVGGVSVRVLQARGRDPRVKCLTIPRHHEDFHPFSGVL